MSDRWRKHRGCGDADEQPPPEELREAATGLGAKAALDPDGLLDAGVLWEQA